MSHLYTNTKPDCTAKPPRKRRVGRPAGTGTGRTKTTCSLSLPPALWARLKALATSQGRNLSQTCEEILTKAVKL